MVVYSGLSWIKGYAQPWDGVSVVKRFSCCSWLLVPSKSGGSVLEIWTENLEVPLCCQLDGGRGAKS